MSDIVGVHGIAQEQLGRKQLLAAWGPALDDGVELAAGTPVELSFDLAFYGDLFLPTVPSGTGGVPKGLGDDPAAGLGELTAADADEEAFLQAATKEGVAALGLAKDLPEEVSKGPGPGPAPTWFQFAARRLDAALGAKATALFVGELRQVHRYLTDPKITDEVLTRVTSKVAGDCRVLIGHSLGSVVAYEAIGRLDGPLDLLVTLGSPLGLRSVRDRLPQLTPDPATGLPSGVRRWVNVYDRHDPVACAGGLWPLWPEVVDVLVENGNRPHAVERYLSKRETGRAVHDALASAC